MNTIREQAIVLRRTNYGEADRIVQFITPSGKLSALARGVRREKSKLAGGIELLAVSDVTLHEGRGELYTLTSARLERVYAHILEDYDRLQFAYYVLKDIARVSEQIDEPDFFTVLRYTLEALNTTEVTLGVVELCYRLQIAKLLGQDVNLVRDEAGKKLQEDTRYQFDIGAMAFVEKRQGEYTSDHVKLLRLATVSRPEVVSQVKGLDGLLVSCLYVARAAHE